MSGGIGTSPHLGADKHPVRLEGIDEWSVAGSRMRLNVGMSNPQQKILSKEYFKQWYEDVFWWRPLHQTAIRRYRENPWGLFKTSLVAIFLLAIFSIGLWFGLSRILGDGLPWELDSTGTTRYSVTRMVLLVGAGLVGIVGVIVAYRRQQGHEEGQFLERLGDSARQLGDTNPTIQAAGIYALAGMADTERQSRRQQCLDVLCAYLRLPYSPFTTDGTGEIATTIVRKYKTGGSTGLVEEERTLTLRPHEFQTRKTIFHVINQHLQDGAEVSWSKLNFNFSGAIFEDVDFQSSKFFGEVIFENATFIGEDADFHAAEFYNVVSFRNTKFHTKSANFRGATFSGLATFRDATFKGRTNFRGVNFNGAAHFRNAIFNEKATFKGAKFTASHVSSTTQWNIQAVDFTGATFNGDEVNFQETLFDGREVIFDTQFNQCRVDFKKAVFNSGLVKFFRRTLYGSSFNFQHASFSGGTVTFQHADFNGATVNFQNPKVWRTPPIVPWRNNTSTPAGVSPDKWPPLLQSNGTSE